MTDSLEPFGPHTGTVPIAPDHFAPPELGDRCRCLSGEVFGACCGPFLARETTAPTAVQLMRSRYSAYAAGDAAYLLETWHPSTRPAALELDPSTRWYRLDVLRREAGGPLDGVGLVEFRAYARRNGDRLEQHEVSRFVRELGQWRYLDAVD